VLVEGKGAAQPWKGEVPALLSVGDSGTLLTVSRNRGCPT
jgi:hypothetical protein